MRNLAVFSYSRWIEVLFARSSQFRFAVEMSTLARGLAGAVAGGMVGYFAFFWIAGQGFYALVLPPVLLGFMAGLCARGRSTPLALVCGAAGLLLGLFFEWRYAPFVADGGLLYFITHIHKLRPITLIMLAVGVFFSYRLALGRDRTKLRDGSADSTQSSASMR